MIGDYKQNDNSKYYNILISNASPEEKAKAWAESNNENYKQYILTKNDIYSRFDYQGWKHEIDFDFEKNEFRYPKIEIDKENLNNGHLKVLFDNGKIQFKLNLQRMLYCIYIGDLTNTNLIVDHHDEDKLNNRPENLQLMTQWENHIKCFEKHFYWLKDFNEILYILKNNSKEDILKGEIHGRN